MNPDTYKNFFTCYMQGYYVIGLLRPFYTVYTSHLIFVIDKTFFRCDAFFRKASPRKSGKDWVTPPLKFLANSLTDTLDIELREFGSK